MGRAGLSNRGETIPMKKPAQHLITEVRHRQAKVETTVGIDLGEVWSHYYTSTRTEQSAGLFH
jgi:hypothetical protein